MDEKVKYRREIIFKVLSWGTIAYLFVIGYAVNQSGLFEMRDASPAEKAVDDARENQAVVLTNEAESFGNTNEAAKARVDAAKIRLENYEAAEKRLDGKRRGFGLICGAIIYSLLYCFIVNFIYNRTAKDVDTGEDVVPKKYAMAYAAFMSVATCVAAFSTALQ